MGATPWKPDRACQSSGDVTRISKLGLMEIRPAAESRAEKIWGRSYVHLPPESCEAHGA
jgi:hypothetical protein